MMPLFRWPWEKNLTTIGVDLGAVQVKVAGFSKTADGLRLDFYGRENRQNGDALREFFSAPSFREGAIRVNIEDPSLKIRRVEIPEVPKEEIPEMLKWGLSDVLGESLDETLIRYQPLPRVEGKREVPWLVFAVGRSGFDSHRAFLREMGLKKIESITPNVSGLHAAWTSGPRSGGDLGERCVALIDMGGSFTHFSVVLRDQILFSRPLGGMAGESLTKQIARSLSVDDGEGEKWKLAAGKDLDPQRREQYDSTVRNYSDRAAIEIQRSIDDFNAQFPGEEAKALYFTGGAALLEGFLPFIAETLMLPAREIDSFSGCDPGKFDPEQLRSEKHFYALAAGLASAEVA